MAPSNYICICSVFIYINIVFVYSTQINKNVVVTGAPSIPPDLVNQFQKESKLYGENIELDSVKNLYNDPKVSKFISLINGWYKSNNYIGSGVTNVAVKERDNLHITCNELRLDKYSPIEIHTFKQTEGSKEVDSNLTNVVATLADNKMIGTTTGTKKISEGFILHKMGLEPGKSFKWDSSKWEALESCGLFKSNSIVKLVNNPKDNTVTLHVYLIENPTKIIGPFIGNILNAYKEPIFGLKFQNINLMQTGIIGSISTSVGLAKSDAERKGYLARPYKVLANITYDIVESFIWRKSNSPRPCTMLSLRGFADNEQIGAIFNTNFKTRGVEGSRYSLLLRLDSSDKLRTVTELGTNHNLAGCIVDTNISLHGTRAVPWKHKCRGIFDIKIPIGGIFTALECALDYPIKSIENENEVYIRGIKSPSLGKFNTSYELNLSLFKIIPLTLPSPNEKIERQVGNGMIGMYLSMGGGNRNVINENIRKIESSVVAALGIMAGINNIRVNLGLPIVKIDNYSKTTYLPDIEPKLSIDVKFPINS